MWAIIVLATVCSINTYLIMKITDELNMLNRMFALKCAEYDSFIQWHNVQDERVKDYKVLNSKRMQKGFRKYE